MALDLKTSAAVTLNFDKVQGLRDLEDKALSLSAYCKGSLRIIETMKEISAADFRGVWSISSCSEKLLGYIEDLSVLTNRINNTVDLVSPCECEASVDHQLMKAVAGLVCVCVGLEESVHGSRYQSTCVQAGRRYNSRHSSCEVDHIPDVTISAC